MAFRMAGTLRNVLFCLSFIFGCHLCSEPSQVSLQTYKGLRGIEKSYGCFGVDGLKATANQLNCNEGERVCIMDVVYGVKGDSQNISCPHAVAYEIPSQCCTPEPYDCIIQANGRKKNDLILECNYLSLTNCLLRVDRLDVRDVCVLRNGITTSSFRAIKYACAPNSLVELGQNPCSALPPLDDPIWNSIGAKKEEGSEKSVLNQSVATLIISSIIGFSTFFVVFILLMMLGINCTSWMVDPDNEKKTDGEDDLDDISLKSGEIGRTILNENYNIYITIPNQPRRPDKTVFSSNNAAKHNKRFYYTRVVSTPVEDLTRTAIRNVNNRFPLLEIPGEMQIKVEDQDDSSSPPPSYQSRVDTPVSMDSSPSSANPLIPPKRKKASSVEQRYQMLMRGNLLGESNELFGDYFAPRVPRRIIPPLKKLDLE